VVRGQLGSTKDKLVARELCLVLIVCAIIAALVMVVFAIAPEIYKVALAELEAETAEAQSRTAEANARTAEAKVEELHAEVTLVLATANADALADLIDALRCELRRQGRRATLSTMQMMFFGLVALVGVVVNGVSIAAWWSTRK